MVPRSKERLFYKDENCTIRIKPCSFDEFKLYISDYIDNLNYENKILLSDTYLNYINLYDRYHDKTNKLRLSNITAEAMGIWSRSNSNIKYWLARGWDLNTATAKLKQRQNTGSISSIMIKHNLNEDDARIKQNKQYKQSITTTKSRPDYDRIKKDQGKSNKPESLLNKINEETGINYTLEEAIITISKKQSIRATNFWKDVKSGNKKYNSSVSLQYFLDKGFDLSISIQKQSKRQSTFSLDICIEKYGIEEGYAIFKKRQDKWQDTLNKKSEEEKRDINICKFKNHNNRFYSTASYDFFNLFIKILSSYNIIINDPKFSKHEYYIYNKVNKKIYFYDFTLLDKKLIIEYNGSHVHPNKIKLNTPELWNNWKNVYNKMTADQNYQHDFDKIKCAESFGFTVYTVWDTDDYIDIINKIIKNEFNNNTKN